ncbi:trans-sulfuration enzyme family protein [Bacillus solimangrovi]|uniref:homocysteine desulfhydrase n=1 Tax=Bacillus solimangrovi TaxID=1305675 RepID=A0A1E5LCA9_9BACI|nr:aminotransferase class I/II-fold pyridoxal phosphate-dependent enzyme [Bacillus solimangrovi]OEH91722.1 cystathionine gamma-synthase [Bacillus solimangrovi]
MSENFDTKAVHLNNTASIESKSKTRPIYQTSVFSFENLDDLEGYFRGEKNYLYTRMGNPNVNDLAISVAKLEDAPEGIAAASGMAAILAGILSIAGQGDHIVASKDIYGGTHQLLVEELKRFGIEISLVSFENHSNVKEAIQKNTKLIYSESITNPLLRVEDIHSLVQIAKENNLKTMIDNTFATPYLYQPYKDGIDLVVHSATKYIAGHSDVTAGVLVGHTDLVREAGQRISNLGANLSPFEAWLGCRGLKTLHVRMQRHVENAYKLAAVLSNHEAIDKLYYPESFSNRGNGAIVTIDITKKCDIKTFFEALSWVKIVPSLAGCETSVSYPVGTSHRSLPETLRDQLGITEGLVRISVGLEDIEDIINEFDQALQKALL